MLRSSFRPQRLGRSLHTSRFHFADAKETASKAADSARQAASKASDTASKATAQAQEYASKAIEQSQKFAKAIGDTSGKLLSNAGPRVNGLVDRAAGLQKPIVYWGKVTGEVAKQGMLVSVLKLMIVYLKEKMSPPSGAQFQETFDALRQQLSKPDKIFSKVMEYADINKVRQLGWQPFARAGLRGVELFGFFCIGEMVGRRSIKGYKV
jgi:F-type H+-transporting ATPase subunit g